MRLKLLKNFFTPSFTASTTGINATNTRRWRSRLPYDLDASDPLNQFWPIRAMAAFRFIKEPVYVSLAFVACSPNASFIASENISNETLPSVTICRISASVLPKCLAIVAEALMPRAESRKRSSPITRPCPATLVKIPEISSYEDPAIAATPEIPLSESCISLPDRTPEAANCEAAIAAASRP